MDIMNNKCGCKGVRSCLLCEKNKHVKLESFQNVDEKESVVYSYCSLCDLCWPEKTTEKISNPLYLGNVNLIHNFISDEEESFLVSSIDKIPWMLSQSGRRKQDFGPKANFKKKKVKKGDFKGFPKFTKEIIDRLQTREELIDFLPVELCHLEYIPDRGSSIEPHVDDVWLWGDRLVTVNLLSSTVLTLTPTPTSSCLDWPVEMRCDINSLHVFNKCATEATCEHKLSVLKDTPNLPQFKEFCSMCRCGILSNYKVEIKVTLPPKSLFVLSGCARCNWFHEIKRKDVTSRRLAMTYRELSQNFLLKNSKEKCVGSELLEIARNFQDFSIDETEKF